MNDPADLRYSETHQWARVEADGTVTVGITDHAQAQLGDVVFVQPPEIGRSVRQGDPVGAVESVKAASDVHTPVSGEVVAVNAELNDRPERVNEEPYSAWMFRLKPSDASELDRLLDADGYGKILQG